jgi:hypothetical protein
MAAHNAIMPSVRIASGAFAVSISLFDIIYIMRNTGRHGAACG